MTPGGALISRTARDLRHEFDLTFAKPDHPETVEFENLLAIRAGSTPYAIRLSAITNLFVGNRITALPNAPPALLGIVGFRGIILPVYSLRVLLGHPVGGNPRWMLLVERTHAFAFDEVDGCIRVSRDTILLATFAETASKHANEVVRTLDAVRPIVNFSSVLKSIGKQAGSGGSRKE